MPAQDVREIIPRVRRAVEGPVAVQSPLPADALLAMAADAIADVILMTTGAWPHTLVVTGHDAATGFPSEWAVDPGLSLEEESVIAAQAALSYFFHAVKDQKVSERMRNEGQEWEYTISATVLRDWIKLLQGQRDTALAALGRKNPAMARYASFLQVRDRVASAVLEPWVAGGGVGGGQEGSALWVPV